MSSLTPVAGDRTTAGHRRVFHGWRIVAVFAITQTVGYGTLYYAFAVLLHPIARDLHTSATTVTGAFTTAILTWAVMAVPVGRWRDRHGGRAVMTLGALAGAAVLVAWSQIHTVWQLYAVFIGLGATMSMALYEPATAVIVSWFDPARRPKALLAMIVAAGVLATPVTLATAGAPLAAALLAATGGFTPVLAVIGAASLTAAAGILTRAHSPRPARSTPTPRDLGTESAPSR